MSLVTTSEEEETMSDLGTLRRRATALLAAGALALSGAVAAGCGEDDAEDAGQEIENTAEDAANEVGGAAEDAGKELEGAAEDVGKEVEDAAEDVEKEVDGKPKNDG
jgi:hypothetical protein